MKKIKIVVAMFLMTFVSTLSVQASCTINEDQFASTSKMEESELNANDFGIECLAHGHEPADISLINHVRIISPTLCIGPVISAFHHLYQDYHSEVISPLTQLSCNSRYPRKAIGYGLSEDFTEYKMTCFKCRGNAIKIQTTTRENHTCNTKWKIKCLNPRCNNLYVVNKSEYP